MFFLLANIFAVSISCHFPHSVMDLSIQQTHITCCICAPDCSRYYRETKALHKLSVLVIIENIEVEGDFRRGIESWEVTMY